MSRGARARLALVALALVAILFVFVFPTRSYLAQRRQVSTAQHDVDVLREQNDALQAKATELEKPSEIERMGREQFHLVFPGETPYIVSPGEPTPFGNQHDDPSLSRFPEREFLDSARADDRFQ